MGTCLQADHRMPPIPIAITTKVGAFRQDQKHVLIDAFLIKFGFF
jgi:hypothetical protein